MSVTLRWLLRQKDLKLINHADKSQLDRRINFAQTTELQDPRQWLSGGELLLTTGLRLPLSASGRAVYIERLAAAGVSALGFGTGLSHPHIPTDMLNSARQLHFPIVEVPLEIPFAAVTRAVMARLSELQYESTLRVSIAQPRMTRAAARGGPAAVTKEVALATGSTAVLFDDTLKVISVHPESPTKNLEKEVAELIKAGAEKYNSGVSVTSSGRAISVHKVAAGSVTHGYLALIRDTGLSNLDKILLGHATSLLALDYEKPERLRKAQTALNSSSLRIALSQNLIDEEIIGYLTQAADSNQEIRILQITGEPLNSAIGVLDHAFKELHRPFFMRANAHELLVLLQGKDNVDTIEQLIRGLPTAKSHTLRLGVSSAHPVSTLSLAVEQARSASAFSANGAPVFFNSAIGGGLLADPHTHKLLEKIARERLHPLFERDQQQNTGLVHTLRIYLQAHGNWAVSAEELGVHRHNLRSRVARINELLDLDLNNAGVRAELLLALMALT
ncbi:MAG: PucR family transcriptional regulator [Mycobacteriaceae bacterium]